MAYILGIISTDGCLVERDNGCNCLDITNNERELLDKIKKLMDSEHKICSKKRGFRFHVRNNTIYSDLLKLGLTPRKSKSLQFPKIPTRYISDFIRGCFDGDGGVTVWQEKRWNNTWQIRTTFASGSKNFLIKLHNTLIRYGKLEKGKIWYSGRAYELHFGIEDSLKFYKFIYSGNNNLYLRRKKEAFEKFVTLRNTHR